MALDKKARIDSKDDLQAFVSLDTTYSLDCKSMRIQTYCAPYF